MKFARVCLLLLLYIYTTYTTEFNCNQLSTITNKICKRQTSKYNYDLCVHKRLKRSNCSTSCDACDCNACSQNTCKKSCNFCCFPQHTCYQRCVETHQCKSSSCRDGCNSDCKREGEVKVQVHQPSSNNFTTILNLHNFINTTNIVNVTTNINVTTNSNFSIFDSRSHQRRITPKEQCCQIVEKKCDPVTKKCEQITSNRCDDSCQTQTVTEKTVYVPTYPKYPPNYQSYPVTPNYYYYPVYHQYQQQYQQRQCWPFTHCRPQQSVQCVMCSVYPSGNCKDSCYGNQPCQQYGGDCSYGNSGFGLSYGGYGMYQQPSWGYPLYASYNILHNYGKKDVTENDYDRTAFGNLATAEVIPFPTNQNASKERNIDDTFMNKD